MGAVTLLLMIGATYRLSMLACCDEISQPIRDRLAGGFHERLWLLVTCPWCVSVWIGAVVAIAGWHGAGDWWFVIPAAAATASAATGALAEHASP